VKTVIRILSYILFYGLLFNPQPGSGQSPEVNVLLFTADDLDIYSLGCHGSKVRDISPNIDRFAREGIRFEHAFVNASICVPSRAILATGMYGHNNGVMGFVKMKEGNKAPLLMEILRAHHYRVGVLGKVGHSTPKPGFKWDFKADQDELGNGRSPTLYYQKSKAFYRECLDKNQPFYLMINSHDPHRPFFNPDEPLTGGAEAPSRIYSPGEIEVPGFVPDLSKVRLEMSYYYNSVKRLDDTFGRVMQALDESGYRDNTLVVFISDNGIAIPFAKCNVYHASNRSPWLVRWPGVIKPGLVNDKNLISEIDFMPTILDALGIDQPETMDGKSHLTLYTGEEYDTEDIIFTQIDSKAGGTYVPMRGISVPMRGVQNREYLYIYNAWVDGARIYANNNEGLTMMAMEEAAEKDPVMADRVKMYRYRIPEEFYVLTEDPDCLYNRIFDPAYGRQINDMRGLMEKKMKETGDPLLVVFRNRYYSEIVRRELYKIYPEIRKIDTKVDEQQE
jgi:N-sulfoglucosamine sulfohydrolase